MSLASGSCQSWLQWGRNLAEFDSGLPCFKFCFQRHAPIVRGLVSLSHIHRFDSPLPPVFCGSSAAFALAAPRVQLCGCEPAGACLQDVFDLPVLGRSSGSFLVPRISPFVSKSFVAICSSTTEPFQEQYCPIPDAEMSTKFFLPNLGSSYSHVEDVVGQRLGRTAHVDKCVHQVCLTDS